MEQTRTANVRVLNSRPDLEKAAAEEITRSVRFAILERGVCHLALAGGDTPRPVYRLLSEPPFRERIDWNRVHLYFSDERMVPPNDPASNFNMVSDALISRVPIPAEHVHRIRGEMPPREAAASYAQELSASMPAAAASTIYARHRSFDLLVLGIGDDGHTASLFPGTDAVDDTTGTACAVFVPKFDAWRVSLTLPVINASREIVFLVSGRSKARVVKLLLSAASPARELPASLVHPAAGSLLWLLDRDAASEYSGK